MSRLLLENHRSIWNRKPVLSKIYSSWFDTLLDTLPDSGRILEVGAGPGFFSEYARKQRTDLRWVSSELLETPWNDIVADGLQLPFRNETFHGLVALDLVHHLAHPQFFFEEARRILRKGGHIAVIEPWVTALSYPIYRWLHQEGCRLYLDPWNPFDLHGKGTKDSFQGDAAVVWRLIRNTPQGQWEELGFHPPRVKVLNGFAYLFSLGFKEPSLLPAPLAPLLMKLDLWATPLAKLLGIRMMALWKRNDKNFSA